MSKVPDGLIKEIDGCKDLQAVVDALGKYYDLKATGLNVFQKIALKHYLPMLVQATGAVEKK